MKIKDLRSRAEFYKRVEAQTREEEQWRCKEICHAPGILAGILPSEIISKSEKYSTQAENLANGRKSPEFYRKLLVKIGQARKFYEDIRANLPRSALWQITTVVDGKSQLIEDVLANERVKILEQLFMCDYTAD